MDKLGLDPLLTLAIAEQQGTEAAHRAAETVAATQLRRQHGEWLELPAALDTTGTYCRLGYYESQEVEALGWVPPPGAGEFVLREIPLYMINLATFVEAGFVFHPLDLSNYIQWLHLDNLWYRIRKRFDDWATEHGVYYAGQGEEPYVSIATKRRKGIRDLQVWGENYYLRGQHNAVFIRGLLPEGWVMMDDGHHYGYWTSVRDKQGDERASIFFKSYESCHMRLVVDQSEWGVVTK